jgi:hypothetical protein
MEVADQRFGVIGVPNHGDTSVIYLLESSRIWVWVGVGESNPDTPSQECDGLWSSLLLLARYTVEFDLNG